MRIAFVVQRYGEEINGGAEQHCRKLATYMAKKHDVEVLTTTALDYYTWENHFPFGNEIIDGVKVRRFNSIAKRNEFKSILDSERYSKVGYFSDINWMYNQGPLCPDLVEYLSYQKDSYDVFVFFTYLYYTTYAGLSQVANKSILIPTAHDEDAIYKPIFRCVFNLPRGIFFNTPEEADFVHKLFKNDYIPYEIGGIGFDDVVSVKRNFNKIDGKYFLYAGRITERKGCDELFDFVKRLDSDYKLVLIGKEDIEVPKSDKIISLGFVPDEEKISLIENSGFVVVPSKFESFSMIMAEAMMLKKPVLVNGLCDVLKGHMRRSDGGVYYTDFDEFASCVDYLSNSENREKLGENGYNYIKDNYTWEKISLKLEGLIDRVLNKSTKG